MTQKKTEMKPQTRNSLEVRMGTKYNQTKEQIYRTKLLAKHLQKEITTR